MMKKAGEIWTIIHSRKGKFTAKLLQDVDPTSENFFDCEITEGEARFMTTHNALPGEIITIKASMVKFIGTASQ